MSLFERLIGPTNGAQQASHLRRKHLAHRRCFVGVRPGHFRTAAMVREVVESKTKTLAAGVLVKVHDLAEGCKLLRLAIRAEPHHLVFVAKFQEAEKLRNRAIE